MKNVRDLTGRFNERPHFEPSELDSICDRVLLEHVERRDAKIEYPISTDFLLTLIEVHASDLDLYADLSAEGTDVEGVTVFVRGKRPSVRISATLAGDARREVRLRTTLAHEFGHVHLHDALFQSHADTPDLFGDKHVGSRQQSARPSNHQDIARCKRATIVGAPNSDWMEWQAGYVCGALLMPRRQLRDLVHAGMRSAGQLAELEIGSALGQTLVHDIVARFFVSAEAAQVRLRVLGLAVEKRVTRSVFE